MRALGSLPEIPGRSRNLGRGTLPRPHILALGVALTIILPGLPHSGTGAAFAAQASAGIAPSQLQSR